MKKYRIELTSRDYETIRGFIDEHERLGWSLNYFTTEYENEYENEYTAVMAIERT